VSENPLLTASEKQSQLHALFAQELQAIAPEAQRVQAALDGAFGSLTQAQTDQLTEKLRVLRTETAELGFKIQTTNFTGGVQAGLLQWVNQFGTAAQQVSNIITGTLNTAINGAAQAITGLIFGTKNLGQAAYQVFQSMIQQVIQWGIQMLVTHALGSILRRRSTSEQTQANAEVLATATPAAVASSGATSGSNWIIGAIAAGVAIAAIIALIAGGFEKGGYTGRLGTKTIAGVVHGDEFVHDSPTTNLYGRDFHQAILEHRIPVSAARALMSGLTIPVRSRFGSFEDGGLVASIASMGTAASFTQQGAAAAAAPAGETKLSNYVLLDARDLRKRILNDDAAEIWLTDVMSKKSYRIRKRS
jgi:hypothetical protein